MPAPRTIEEFLELVQKSGVVETPRLQGHVDRLRSVGQLPEDPTKLAAVLVRDGVLTHFQAEQFLQGKWRRFTIGKYKVLERLGAGGMGSVYLCEHMLMRRRVAVKVLPAAKANDSSSLERFYREARAVAALDHPNIVRAYDIDQDDNLHFLVMEHVDGSSLQEIIKKTGPMDVLRTAHYMRQAALGLQHAHETAALVHRDIKPGNVLVDRNGVVKILDMGLARFFHDDQDDLTKKFDENVLGTADYLAPEQALDSHTADIRADIYSLGGTFYFCLTGRTPFSEGTVAQKLIWHQTRQPKPIRSVRPEVPEGIVAVIEKMMAKDKGSRYQTPLEVAEALEPWTQTPIPPPPEIEMPQFSLAARASAAPETGTSLSSKTRGEPVVPVPPVRKTWQMSGGSAPSNTPSTPGPRATIPPTPRPGPQTSSPPARPAPSPRLASSGTSGSGPANTAHTNNGRKAVVVFKPTVVEEEEPEEKKLPAMDLSLPRGATSRWAEIRAMLARQPLLLWLSLAAGGLLLVTILLISLLIGGGGNRTPKQPVGREPIRVKGGVPNALFTALRKAKDGDRILLSGDIQECSLSVNKQDLIIEAEAGKQVTWKCPPSAPQGSKLLIVEGVSGFQLRGITLDGSGKTEALVLLYGKCPGAILEDLELQNTGQYGLFFTNCEGSREAPVQLNNLTFRTKEDQTALRFDLQKGLLATVKKNAHFRIQGCKFEGAGKKLTSSNPVQQLDLTTFELPSDLKPEQAP